MMKRRTIQRDIVLQAVNAMQGHVTAEEIYAYVAQQHPNIARATVYRNLGQLAEAGEIRRVEVPGGADRFERRTPNHYHVRCSHCGRLFDVDMPYLGNLPQQIRDTHGFEIDGYDILFRGVCPDCRRQTAGPENKP